MLDGGRHCQQVLAKPMKNYAAGEIRHRRRRKRGSLRRRSWATLIGVWRRAALHPSVYPCGRGAAGSAADGPGGAALACGLSPVSAAPFLLLVHAFVVRLRPLRGNSNSALPVVSGGGNLGAHGGSAAVVLLLQRLVPPSPSFSRRMPLRRHVSGAER